MRFLKNKRFWTIAFYSWIILILILTTLPFSPEMKKQNEGGFRFDYLEHLFVFALIPILYYLSGGAYLNRLLKSRWTIFTLGILYSFFAEFQQKLNPDRSFNPFDLGFNLAGFLAGVLLIQLIERRK